jgi:hypothetical protein
MVILSLRNVSKPKRSERDGYIWMDDVAWLQAAISEKKFKESVANQPRATC